MTGSRPERLPHDRRHAARMMVWERAVFDPLSAGAGNKIIARRLCVSENTVKFHLKNIDDKLGANHRVEAICAIRAEAALRTP